VIFLANKGLAHATIAFNRHSGDANLLDKAFRCIPKLLVAHFYAPLGLELPEYELRSRDVR
jgi:hypothetical protein